jgi:hypothetical protein
LSPPVAFPLLAFASCLIDVGLRFCNSASRMWARLAIFSMFGEHGAQQKGLASVCSTVYLSVCASRYLSVCASVCPSLCPSVCLSVCLSFLFCVRLSVFSVCLSVCLFLVCRSVCQLPRLPASAAGGNNCARPRSLRPACTRQRAARPRPHRLRSGGCGIALASQKQPA